MKVANINRWMRKIGFVLVVKMELSEDGSINRKDPETEIYITTWKKYLKFTEKSNTEGVNNGQQKPPEDDSNAE